VIKGKLFISDKKEAIREDDNW